MELTQKILVLILPLNIYKQQLTQNEGDSCTASFTPRVQQFENVDNGDELKYETLFFVQVHHINLHGSDLQ